MTAIDRGTIDYKNEVLRKSIHLCSLSIPVIYYFITEELALSILIPLALFSVVVDLGRYFIPSLKKPFYAVFGFLLRDHEKNENNKKLNGATYVLLSAVIMILFFPKIIVVTAFTVLILSDTFAALIGRKFGRHKFLSKSLEGSLTFFVIGILIVIFAPKVNGGILEYLIGFIAVGIGTIVENISFGYADDNLTIPISIGLTMWVLYSILLPDLNLILQNVPL
ncbi:MAG: dolichol kinase [Melioribacteraceae bacterium]|nr:MAG: dolichol kinase [Melioribacteraceae bacterium]